ncbi:MAG: chemotaxis protein CheW [Gammaproteobacteria bacterium]
MNLGHQLNETTRSISTAAGQYLTFILAGAEYGVDILRVQEIKGWDTATEIPNTPEYIRGVINLRGTIVPIVDLRKRFHMEAVAYGNTTVVVVLKVKGGGGERTMGFVVDAVSDVYNVTVDQINAAPDFGSSVNTEFVKGLATVEDKMVILLDIDRLVEAGVPTAEQPVTH